MEAIVFIILQIFYAMRAVLKIEEYVWVIDQVWGQDGWILAKFFICVVMDRDVLEVHKLA